MLGALAGFVFDLDGCVWQGERLNPGAAETLARLHAAGRGVAYLTNNSRATGADISAKLRRLGVTPFEPALTPLEILGTVIAERYGPSRVLAIGSAELAAVVKRRVTRRRRQGLARRHSRRRRQRLRPLVRAADGGQRAAAAGPARHAEYRSAPALEDGDFLPGWAPSSRP